MEKSEPTTGAIVRALRFCGDNETKCTQCQYTNINAEGGCFERLSQEAADRLESQERDLETLRAFHERYAEQTSKQYVVAVCGLTARAEQAERERDAAVAMFKNATRGVEGMKRGQRDERGSEKG